MELPGRAAAPRAGWGVRIVAAAAAAAAVPAASSKALPAWAAGVYEWVLRRWLSIGGAKIWPPRKQTAPLYLSVWAVVTATLYFGFIRVGKSRESELEAKRKREYAEASLKNLLEYEEKRLQEEAAAAAKLAVAGRDTQNETETHTQKQATEKPAEGKQGKDEEEDKKTAPDVQKMLSLLYDEVEAGAITSLGVDKDEGWYRASVDLLKGE